MKKFLLIIVVALCLPVTMWAYDFEVDGIYYNITSETEVAVTRPAQTNTIKDMVIPETVEYAGNTYTVTSIEANAYFDPDPDIFKSYAGNLTTLVIPSTVKTIGDYAFRGMSSSLKGLTILSCETMGKYAFAFSGDLTNVTFPANLKTVGEYAFASCLDLFTIVFLGDEPPTFEGADHTFGINSTGKAYVSAEAYDTWNYAKEWTADIANALAWYQLATFDYAEIDIEATDNEGDGYATYYNNTNDVILPDLIEAYTISSVSSDGVLTTNNLYGLIPAKTPVLLKGEVGEHRNAPSLTASLASFSGTNLLYGSSTETTTNVNGNEDDYYFYKLTVDAATESKLGFYWGAEDGAAFTMPANKAWLAIPRPSQSGGDDEDWPYGVPSLKFNFDGDETTGITSVVTPAVSAPAGIYSLQGVRVSDMSQKGVYIVDGKKVIVK